MSLVHDADMSETLRAILDRGRLVVGVKTDYDGVGFLQADGSHAGVEVELARHLAAGLLGDAAKIGFVPVTFADRVELLLAGRIDLIVATMVTTPERLHVVDASIPYLQAGSGTLLASKAGVVRSWETCRGHVLAGLDRAYFNPFVIERYGAQIIEFDDAAQAYTALAEGRCAAMVFDEILLRRKVLEPAWADYVIAGKPLGRHHHRIGLRKGNAALLARLDRLVLEAQAAGRITDWLRQYGLTDTWSEDQVAAAGVQLASMPPQFAR